MSNTPKKLGVKQLTIITAVNMMGSGIIMLPANLAGVGTISILSWLVTAVGATLLAFAFARAGMYSNREGGMGGYAEYAHGKSGNFMTNYTYFVSLLIANVAIAVAVVGYGSNFLNVDLAPWPTAFATIGVLWLASALNFGGAKQTGRISAITVWGVILPIVSLCIIGWFWFSPSDWSAAWNPHHYHFFHGVSASIAVTLWAFLGLESACANAGAVENPKKNVPIAVLAGTGIAAVLYIVATNVAQGIVPNGELAASSAPFGLVFAHMFSHGVGQVVIASMVISCFGSLFCWQFTIAEVARSSAIVGYFPKVFKRITSAGAPVVGMVVITVVQTAMALMTVSPTLNKQWTTLVNLSVMTNLIPYLLCMAALVALQKIEQVAPKVARGANIVAGLATVYCLYALYSTGTQAMMYGGLVTFAGWMLYGLISPRFEMHDGGTMPDIDHVLDAEPDIPEPVEVNGNGRARVTA